MKFWAIAYQWHEDLFYDFEKKKDTQHLNETCFLPTRELAVKFVAEELGADYEPVEILVEKVEKNGVWSYTRGRIESWDSGLA